MKNEVRDERGTTRADDPDKKDPRAPPEPGPPKTRILRATHTTVLPREDACAHSSRDHNLPRVQHLW